jgi:hypothetical protein
MTMDDRRRSRLRRKWHAADKNCEARKSASVDASDTNIMLISKGEKIHVVHRRLFEKDTRKHFVGEVEAFEHGILRAVGNVYVIEDVKENVFRRKPEPRTRIIRVDGSVFVNVLPTTVNLDKIRYEGRGGNLRVTDGAGWHLDVKEFGWA